VCRAAASAAAAAAAAAVATAASAAPPPPPSPPPPSPLPPSPLPPPPSPPPPPPPPLPSLLPLLLLFAAQCTTLDAGDPMDLANRYQALLLKLPTHVSVLGGCCGTDAHLAK
jgi:hypothetical protein